MHAECGGPQLPRGGGHGPGQLAVGTDVERRTLDRDSLATVGLDVGTILIYG